MFSGLSSLVIEGVDDDAGTIVVRASTLPKPVACPGCAVETSRVHGYVERRIADVPVDGRRVMLRVRARRMRCRRLGCPRQTFREQLDGVAERYQRRTARLAAQVGRVVAELAGRAGARVLSGLGVALSRHTALRMLLRLPVPVRPVGAVAKSRVLGPRAGCSGRCGSSQLGSGVGECLGDDHRVGVRAPIGEAAALPLAQRVHRQQGRYVSHETIYRSLFIQARGVLTKELVQHLRTRRTMRRAAQANTAGQARGQIQGAVPISQRPAEAADRAIPGSWEGDLLVGTKDSQSATVVERSSRYVLLVRTPSKDAATVATCLTRQVKRLPEQMMRSLTWDRGTELAEHKRFTVSTDVDVYFADPHSPWQRGTNENSNRLLRQ